MPPVDREMLRAQINAMPKVELHRHLEGSLRLETLLDIARQYHIPLPSYEVESLRPHVQMTAHDPHNLDQFLSKFGMLRRFYRSPEILRRITREVIEDAAADNVRYLELRFTPSTLANQMHFPLLQVMEWVCDTAAETSAALDIQTRLIVSMNRHERIELGLQTFEAALAFRDRGVVGVDLAGRELGFPARPFGPLFLQASRTGFGITVHAGEWEGPGNVRDAIEHMYANRIGHGVNVVQDSVVVQLARARGVVFEVCPTSNVQSGVVSAFGHHPLPDMRDVGLAVTVNTDDPSISNIALSDEYWLAVEEYAFTPALLRDSVLTAAAAAFLPETEKAALITRLQQELAAVFSTANSNGDGQLATKSE